MNEQVTLLLRALSRLLGWTYMVAWSASFYPQPIHNWKRKSTCGTSIDFPFLNVIGFASYTFSTSSLMFWPEIRRQYAERNPDAPVPTVRANDLAFGFHALVMVILIYSQFYPSLWRFRASKTQRVSRPVAIISALCAAGVLIVAVLAAKENSLEGSVRTRWMWLDLIHSIGYVKLVVTFVKYVPQAWLNYKRKSTVGWTISQILLDVTGGVLSILQLGIDAGIQHNWRDVVNNPVKLGLGNISIFFDLIFIVQHYYLYADQRQESKAIATASDNEPLLRSQA